MPHVPACSRFSCCWRKKPSPFALTPVGDYRFESGRLVIVVISNHGVDGYVQIDSVRWIWLGE